MTSIHRRDFVKTVTAAGMLGACGSAGLIARGQSISRSGSVRAGIPELVNGTVGVTGSVILPAPEESGIEHIVVVTMENRSFDHFFGWLPGADGKQAGLSYADNSGVTHSTSELAPDFTGCGHPDPDHSYDQSRVAYDNGLMDGFLRAGSNDVFSIGYYSEPDLPFYNTLAEEYLVCDRYFASILGPTFSNRMFLWAAQTDRLDDTASLTTLPTIFDRLLAAGVSHRYYFNNLPYLLLWGLKYLLWTSEFSQFLTQAAAGTLPAVSLSIRISRSSTMERAMTIIRTPMFETGRPSSPRSFKHFRADRLGGRRFSSLPSMNGAVSSNTCLPRAWRRPITWIRIR